MSVYRKAPAPLSVAPPAPWWRILRAWLTGSLRLLPWARANRQAETERRRSPHRSSLSWVPRGFAQAMKGWDVEAIDRGYPSAPAPKGPGHRPANIPE